MQRDPLSRQGRSIREMLQSVEDALIDEGRDDYMINTKRGIWQWQTFERARAEYEK